MIMKVNNKNLVLVTLMVLMLDIIGFSQSCLPDGIQFTTQSQIDDFPKNYPNCSEILGGVHIKGNNITNLLGLGTLTSIGGNLWIESTCLESFEGLNKLVNISGDFGIMSNFGIKDFRGFENLVTILGNVTFYNNSLRDLTGLTNLISIGGTLRISQSYKLRNVDNFKNLTFIGGNLEITINDSLISLQGLNALKRIGGSLDLHYNDKLKNLIGTDKIDSIGGNVSIYANDSLTFCAVEGLCRYISNPSGFINIHNNAQGCNSKEEIKKVCDTIDIPEYQNNTHYYVIYPNPVIDKFSILLKNGDKATGINIYDQLGCMVLTANYLNEPIDISRLRRGLYLIEFTIDGTYFRRQIAKL